MRTKSDTFLELISYLFNMTDKHALNLLVWLKEDVGVILDSITRGIKRPG